MEIEVRVNLIDLKRALRRLSARLPDESPSSELRSLTAVLVWRRPL
jgi:hypothetical protein